MERRSEDALLESELLSSFATMRRVAGRVALGVAVTLASFYALGCSSAQSAPPVQQQTVAPSVHTQHENRYSVPLSFLTVHTQHENRYSVPPIFRRNAGNDSLSVAKISEGADRPIQGVLNQRALLLHLEHENRYSVPPEMRRSGN